MTHEGAAHRYPAVHLLWSLPVAVFLSYYTLMISALAYCGFGGCTPPEAGELGKLSSAVMPLGITALAIALPIFAVPWTRRLRLRALVAVAAGLAYTAVGFAVFVNITP